jgi:hypothetical protein
MFIKLEYGNSSSSKDLQFKHLWKPMHIPMVPFLIMNNL